MKGEGVMEWKLELMLLPVSDVDRAKTFYSEKVGFNLDVDHRAGDEFRYVAVMDVLFIGALALVSSTMHRLQRRAPVW
jgi:predicted enzyme related to lactoylglutathione lyase